jgi:hypothetical protein
MATVMSSYMQNRIFLDPEVAAFNAQTRPPGLTTAHSLGEGGQVVPELGLGGSRDDGQVNSLQGRRGGSRCIDEALLTLCRCIHALEQDNQISFQTDTAAHRS